MSQPGTEYLYTDDRADIEETDWFRIIAEEPRRRVLHIARSSPECLTLAELAERITSEYCDDVTDRQQESLQIALHHCHLPLLDEAGILEYDLTNRTLRTRSHS